MLCACKCASKHAVLCCVQCAPWDGALAVDLPDTLQLGFQVGAALRSNVDVVNVKDGPEHRQKIGNTIMRSSRVLTLA